MLNYESRGSGSHLSVLLHGFLGAGRNLSSLARRLTDLDPKRKVILVDLRGHGHSPPLEGEPSLDTLAGDVAELLDALPGDEPIDVFGHSLGGRVALSTIPLRPSRIGRLVLLDIGPDKLPTLDGPMQRLFERLMGAPAFAHDRAELRRFFVEGGVEASLADWILTNLEVDADTVRWRIDRAGLARLHWRETNEDLWQVVEAYGRRIEVVVGGKSGFVSEQAQGRLAELGVSCQTLAGAGHFLHVDALEPLAKLLVAQEGGA